MPTSPGAAIRQCCKDCLGLTGSEYTFDCKSNICALYPAHPFRGKTRPGVKTCTDPTKCAPAERPTRGIIGRMCRQCQPETVAHCTSRTCGLLPLTPFQPGGRPKRPTSEKQLATARQNAAHLPTAGKGGAISAPQAPGRVTGPDGTLEAPDAD